jgi:hypothetical protein
MPVDHPVPDFAGLVITAIAGTQQRATQIGRKVIYRGLLEDRVTAVSRNDAKVCHSYLLPFDWFVMDRVARRVYTETAVNKLLARRTSPVLHLLDVEPLASVA